MSRPIRLVCFDLGGVLVRICRTWAEGCAVVGLDLRVGDPDGVLVSGGFHEINDAYQRGAISEEEFAAGLSGAMDGLYTPEEVVRVHRAWTRGEYPRVLEVLERINGLGLETAALSNTCHEHWEDLVELPTLKTLRHRFASHLLAARKPDPAAYRAVEEATGHAGEAIVFFDDLTENIDAATALGWQAQLIDPQGCTATQIEATLVQLGVLKEPQRHRGTED